MKGRPVILLALLLGCDRDPEPPSGGLWEPCIPIELECSDAANYCLQIPGSEANLCVPACTLGESCPDAPDAAPSRCNADELVPSSFCVIDCLTDLECPAGMTCLFDRTRTPQTGKGVCAWVPQD